MNHCDYFEIYLKAKSLRRLHIRNKKGKFRLFLAAFSAWGQPRSIFIALNRRTREKTSGTQSSLASLLKVMLHGAIPNDVF